MTEREIFLDVSELEPPEPLTETLAAAAALRPGEYLRMRHRRFPCLLEQNLTPRGLRCHIQALGEGIEAFVWRDGDREAERALRPHLRAAATDPEAPSCQA